MWAKKFTFQRLALALGLCSLTFLLSNCTLGLRKETKIVYGNIAAPAAKGAVRIATNDPIAVSVDGEVSEKDLGGYYVVSGPDLKLFIRLLKESSDAKD